MAVAGERLSPMRESGEDMMINLMWEMVSYQNQDADVR